MGNNSILLDIVKGWMESLGLDTASLFQVVLLIMILFILVLSLLTLIFRRTKLWYWKVNVQVKTLQSIDSRLKNVEEGLMQKFLNEEQKPNTEGPGKTGPEKEANIEPAEIIEETLTETKPRQTSESIVGKSGRVYTEEELELQIRE